MSDFIREVDEEYRRERAANFLKRFQVPLVILVVLIIAGAGVWRWYVDHDVAQAEQADARYREADLEARSGQPAQAQAGFGKLEMDGPPGYAVLSGLRNAEVLAARDPDGAAKVLDKIASDETKGTPALRDLARFRGALIRIDREDPAAFDNQYGRFALDTFTFHNGMRELLALAALKRNDLATATKYLNDIVIDPVAAPALRNRAQAFRELVNAGPATTIPAQPGPPTVAPLVSPPAAPPSFEPIAPVGRFPQSTMPPSEPDAAASASEPAATESVAPAPSAPVPIAPAPVAPATVTPVPVAPNATSSVPTAPVPAAPSPMSLPAAAGPGGATSNATASGPAKTEPAAPAPTVPAPAAATPPAGPAK